MKKFMNRALGPKEKELLIKTAIAHAKGLPIEKVCEVLQVEPMTSEAFEEAIHALFIKCPVHKTPLFRHEDYQCPDCHQTKSDRHFKKKKLKARFERRKGKCFPVNK